MFWLPLRSWRWRAINFINEHVVVRLSVTKDDASTSAGGSRLSWRSHTEGVHLQASVVSVQRLRRRACCFAPATEQSADAGVKVVEKCWSSNDLSFPPTSSGELPSTSCAGAKRDKSLRGTAGGAGTVRQCVRQKTSCSSRRSNSKLAGKKRNWELLRGFLLLFLCLVGCNLCSLFFFFFITIVSQCDRESFFANGILRCNIMHMIMFNVPSDSGRVLESQCGLVTPWEQDKNGHRMTNI